MGVQSRRENGGTGLADDYLLEKYLSTNRLAGNTRQAYRRDLERLAGFVASVRHVAAWSAVSQTDLEAWFARLAAEGKSEASLARALSSVRAFFRFLDRGRHVEMDPTVGLFAEKTGATRESAPVEVRSGRWALSVGEIERLLAEATRDSVIAARDLALLEMMYGSGLSVSEVTDLSIADVDLHLECVRCRNRGRKSRVVPLSPSALTALRSYLEGTRPSLLGGGGVDAEGEALFVNHRGKRLTRQGVWKIIKGCGDRAGIEGLSPQALRSSFASHLLANGANLAAVQEMMGHAASTTTQAYLVRDPQMRLRDEYDRAHPRAKGFPAIPAAGTANAAAGGSGGSPAAGDGDEKE